MLNDKVMSEPNKKTAADATSAASAGNIPAVEDKSKSLMQFFKDGLMDMLWAEEAVIEGLKKMQKAASNESLVEALEDHEIESRQHISRLEKIFESLNESPQRKKCAAMEGILKEADEMIKATPDRSATRDVALIIAAQKVEHYEIASYGGLTAIAHTLNLTRAADRLQQTLDDEEGMDLYLTEIAETEINVDAVEEEKSGKAPVNTT